MKIISFLLTCFCSAQLFSQELLFAKSMGGDNADVPYESVMDESGNTFITGRYITSMDVDMGPGTQILTTQNFYGDLFIAKYNNEGSFVWAIELEGNNFNQLFDIATDENGFIYITGDFQGTLDFDPGTSSTSFTALHPDMFIAKYTSSGELVWAKQYTGTNMQRGENIVINSFGDIFISGQFNSNSMEFGPGPGITTLYNETDGSCAFLLCLDTDGNLYWVKELSTEDGSIFTRELEADDNGNVLLHCSFAGTFSIQGISFYYSFTSESDNTWDALLMKIDLFGNIIWADNFHTFNTCSINKMLFLEDRILLCGSFSGVVDFNPDLFATEYRLSNMDDDDQSEGFMLELNQDGEFNWVYTISGTAGSSISSICLNENGDIFMVGQFGDIIDLDEGYDEYLLEADQGYAVFILKMSPDRNISWSKLMHCSIAAGASNLNIDNESELYINGAYRPYLEIEDFEAQTIDSNGLVDFFFVKFHSNPEPGDMNADGLLNMEDLAGFMSLFGCEDCDQFNLDQYPGITTSDLYIMLALLDQ